MRCPRQDMRSWSSQRTIRRGPEMQTGYSMIGLGALFANCRLDHMRRSYLYRASSQELFSALRDNRRHSKSQNRSNGMASGGL